MSELTTRARVMIGAAVVVMVSLTVNAVAADSVAAKVFFGVGALLAVVQVVLTFRAERSQRL